MPESTYKQTIKYFPYAFGSSGSLVNQGGPPAVWKLNNAQSRPSYWDFLSGFQNPRWRDQVRSGQNATTSATGNFASVPDQASFSFGTYSVWTNGDPRFDYSLKEDGFYGPYLPLGWSYDDPPSDVVTRVSNRVISRFLANIQDAVSAFESGQDLGEYRETLRSIHRPLSSLHDKLFSYLDALKKVRSRSRNRTYLSKALADTYLEFRFGWLPLVDDIASAVVKCGTFRFPTVPVKSSSSEPYSVSDTIVNVDSSFSPSYPGWVHPSAHTRKRSVYKLRYKGAVRTHSDPNGRSSSVRELQLLPQNWLPTAWDLLPYSWIADYFTNIGEIISGLSFVFSDLAWAQKTARSVTEQVMHDSFMRSPDPFAGQLSSFYSRKIFIPYSYDAANSAYSITRWSRDVLVSSDLVPRFTFRIPQSKFPYLNIAALLFSHASELLPFF